MRATPGRAAPVSKAKTTSSIRPRTASTQSEDGAARYDIICEYIYICFIKGIYIVAVVR